MKRFFTLLFACYYLLASLGLIASVHFCGGKINTVNLIRFDRHAACCCGKVMKKNCCKDKQIRVSKSQTDEQIHGVTSLTLAPPVSEMYRVYYLFTSHMTFRGEQNVIVSNHSPPPDAKHPIYLRKRHLLI